MNLDHNHRQLPKKKKNCKHTYCNVIKQSKTLRIVCTYSNKNKKKM